MRFLKDFGAIVAIVLASLGAAISYGKLTTITDQHTKDINDLKPQVLQVSQDTAVLKQSVSDIKDSLGRIEDRLGTKR